MAATTQGRQRRLDERPIRRVIQIGLWAAMLTASAAAVTWGLNAENGTNNALALAVRNAPIEMIIGGAIALPSKTAQAWHDWKSGPADEVEAADDSARTPDDESTR